MEAEKTSELDNTADDTTDHSGDVEDFDGLTQLWQVFTRSGTPFGPAFVLVATARAHLKAAALPNGYVAPIFVLDDKAQD